MEVSGVAPPQHEQEESPPTGAEAKLGYRFANRSRSDLALNPSWRGFSRLEFLGDAALGIVIFTMAEWSDYPCSWL